jgi:hypothetical protein
VLHHRRGHILALALVLALSACQTDSTNPDPGNNGGNPSITLTLSASALSLVQGVSGTLTATIARAGGFTGNVTIEVTGAPSGMTATPNPTSIGSSATTSTITIAPGATLAPGNYTLTVRASGTGVTAVTQTFTVTVTAASTGSFTLTIDPTTASIQQGQQTTATVNISRSGGFAGAVNLAVSGGPASGLTASLSPASTTGNTSTLTLASAASLAAGTYNLTVTGNSTGLTQQAASFALTITAAGGGGGNTTWSFCTNQIPTWLAYQDGTGPWTQVQPNNGTFSFPVNSGRGGVAFVASGTQLQIFLGTQAELNLYGARCGGTGTIASKTVNGTMSGLAATDQGFVTFGGSSAVVTSGQSAFTLQNVFEGAFDLVASRSSLSIQGTNITTQMTAGIIRRAINPADNSTMADLNYNSPEAFAPDQRNLTIANLGTDQAIVSSFFITGNGGAASLYTDASVGGGANRMFFAVPNAVRQSGDLQFIQVSALASLSTPNFRSATSYFASSADQTVTLGPNLTGLTVSVLGTTGYARIGATYPIQTEYDDLFNLTGGQASGNTFSIFVTKGYTGAIGNFAYSIPDFSGVSGWLNTYGPQVGSQVTWTFSATGYSQDGGFTTPLQDGIIALTATNGGTITP